MTIPTALLIVAAVALCVSASAKTGSTLYTPDRVANARANVQRYEWARDIRDKAVKEADRYAAQGDDFLWQLITPQSIPRGIEVNFAQGCPKCGLAVKKFGNYPWKVDVFSKPWKIECPSCHELFPKNDFARFYESGKDKHGVFDPKLADRTLLFNADHPDPSDPLHTYGVDDGMGWKDDKGDLFRFIGYYGHFGTWTAVQLALTHFRDAYIYAGDVRYARKAGLMLYRIAEFYPEMDWAYWRGLGFYNSDGGRPKGKIFGCIWEPDLVDTFASCYDTVWPTLTDPDMVATLSKRTGKPSAEIDIRALVERNIIRQVHDAILSCNIEGNEGMYQHTMAAAAIVLDEPGTSEKWLEWIFAPGDMRVCDTSGGNILRLFETRIDNDGMADEASPSYISIWRTMFRSISELIGRYPRYKGPKLTDIPKYRKMFETPARLTCLNRFIPLIGDTGSTGSRATGVSASEMADAYRTFKDPFFAQMARLANGNKATGLRGDIFDAEPEAVAGEIESAVKKHGTYSPKTENLASYGLALLRSGSGDHARALSLYYGRNTGHGHKDTLNIELFAHGLDLMPDHGYPEYATAWPSRFEWTGHTLSHNTVTVDRRKQGDNYCGKARFVTEGKGVSAAEVYADAPYPQTSLYQRTIAMVDASEKDFYIVDIFRVRGGKEHSYSLHGPEGEITTDGMDLTAQAKGTLAGEDVPVGADLGGRENNWVDSTGLQYLYDVRRDANPGAGPSVTWQVKDTWGLLGEPKDIKLRMNLVSPPGEVVIAHGDPPQNKPGNPRRLTYIILPNSGPQSTYVSVVEPYSGQRCVKSIERIDDGDTVTLKITLAAGRTDYITSSLESRKAIIGRAQVTGRFSVVSEQNGKVEVRLAAE